MIRVFARLLSWGDVNQTIVLIRLAVIISKNGLIKIIISVLKGISKWSHLSSDHSTVIVWKVNVWLLHSPLLLNVILVLRCALKNVVLFSVAFIRISAFLVVWLRVVTSTGDPIGAILVQNLIVVQSVICQHVSLQNVNHLKNVSLLIWRVVLKSLPRLKQLLDHLLMNFVNRFVIWSVPVILPVCQHAL